MTVQAIAPSDAPALSPPQDTLLIRGRTLDLSRLLDPRLLDEDHVALLSQRMQTAQPFPHLASQGWFNPTLLELVREEFDLYARKDWRTVQTKYETTHRSLVGAQFGPASQIYFGLVNSGWFVNLLSRISGVDDLIADAHLVNGGLHETRNGGKFGIHRDFDRHPRNGLTNEMVLLTYLNPNWNPAWQGALELWDHRTRAKVSSLEPEMGHAVLMRHGPRNFHGHPQPMAAPDGTVRRSLATYYYTNANAERLRRHRVSSVYLMPDRRDGARQLARSVLPASVWYWLRRLTGRTD